MDLPVHCYIIAEAGVNHNGSVETGLRLVELAARAGCDAVKFQLFRSEGVVAADAQRAPYQGAGSQESLLRGLEMPAEQMARLAARARELGLAFVCTPFDRDSAEQLHAMEVPFFKVSSGDVTNLGFLKFLGGLGRPVLLSTGTAGLGEVEAGVAAVREGLAEADRDSEQGDLLWGGLALMHCVTSYPAPIEQTNLRAMDTLRAAFGVPVGYSDHTLGPEASLAAAARGAQFIEKHITLDRTLPGPDHAASADEDELTRLVAAIRKIESALGGGIKAPSAAERENLPAVRRKVCSSRDLKAGHVLVEADLMALRGAEGLDAGRMHLLPGRTLKRDVPARQAIRWEDV
jgi:N-acetylneuraminate synthase/N,N'-diacetyllegionaminate synthase